MLIAGASGHALEILDILERSGQPMTIAFYDDVRQDGADQYYGYPMLNSPEEAAHFFHENGADFILGLGGVYAREKLMDKMLQIGGNPVNLIAPDARIGKHSVLLGSGLNIMTGAMVSSEVRIGEGSLINTAAGIHHHVNIGAFCEISPGARILGRARLGDYVMVGSGALVLPDVRIGSHAEIGAGSVVTRNVPDGAVITGVPGKLLRQKTL